MSDPMSSRKIEDVLSSIRRLVSEDLRPVLREAPAADRPGFAVTDSRLILTPSLRVVPPVVDPALGWDDEEAWVEEPLSPMAWDDLADVEAPPQPEAAAPAPHRFTLSLPEDDEGGEVAEAPKDLHPLTLTPDLAVPPRTVAEPVDMIDLAARQEFEADEPETWADAGMDASTSDDGPDEGDRDADYERVEVEDDPVGLEAALSDEAEATYDEEFLRDLVRDLIREELAGGLGEKITRNVRKLVRAEIAQALAARALD
jgi:hypothetical protein